MSSPIKFATIAHPTSSSIPPVKPTLKPISQLTIKPHVPVIRNQSVRNSGGPIVLPRLEKLGRNNSLSGASTMLSPVRPTLQGSFSVRNSRGPAAIVQEAKLSQQPHAPTLPPNHALKNFTALELSRFIDKRLTDVSKSDIKFSR